jgi:hypothetical protein
MKKIFIGSIAWLFFFGITGQVFSQTETFDIIHYTPPKDFKKGIKEGVLMYTNTNNATGGFCVIAIYASGFSDGDEQKDFSNEWRNLVVTPYKAEANPKTETQMNSDGWKVVGAATPVKLDGNDFTVLLTVFSGFGKKVSILSYLNDHLYAAQIDALLENLKLDKTTSITNATGGQNSLAGRFGSMDYRTPGEWEEKQYQDAVVLTPADLPSGEHLEIRILPALNVAGSMDDGFKQCYDETCILIHATKMYMAGNGNYSKKQSGRSFKGWEYILGSGAVRINNGNGNMDEYGLDLFVIKINDRFERVAVIKSRNKCGMSSYYPDDRLKYADAIERFLYSLRFSDWKEPLLKPGTFRGDGVVGLWLGISYDPTTLLLKSSHQDAFYPLFLSNGLAYFGPQLPLEGLYEFDAWIAAERQPRYWGTYSFNNGKGVLKMPYGELPLRMENNRLIIRNVNQDYAFSKINPVDGATFNGTYALSAVNGKIPSVSFSPDGRFTDNGGLKVLYHEYLDCVNEGLTGGSGTYEVKDYSVIFKYSDRRKIRIAFIGVDYDKNNPGPATLRFSFNDDLLKRQ